MENHPVSSVIPNSLPKIVVTEPSPVSVTSTSAVSIVRNIESVPEVHANGGGIASESVKSAVKEAAATSEPSAGCSSGEFVPAQECSECVIPVPEPSTSQSVEDTATTVTQEMEQDDFRTQMGCCHSCLIQYFDYYGKVWNVIHSGYTLPIWLLLLALPVSAGLMGALYMYSCPASHSMSILIFIIGISLMVVISLRICFIIRRLTTTAQDDWKNMLHTLMLISTFLTVVFFITESVAYWQIDSSSSPGTQNYCDPNFMKFSFWWNCVTCVVLVPLFIFPA